MHLPSPSNPPRNKMANQEHVSLLRQGVEFWNDWRKKNPAILVGLRGADLDGVDLRAANLSHCDLNAARLTGADLTDASLWYAELTNTHFEEASLGRARMDFSMGGDQRFYQSDLSFAVVSLS